MTAAYYNEIDPFAAEWLRRLILFGHIAPGDVDERDIRDVSPDDLRGYQQHHFFAGIGVWSYALRQAGWPDDRPVATGSCPCQPFSAAGRGGGFADERHLWPAFFHLIGECGFPVVLGEQVASKDGLAWFDLVSADMEGAGYTGGAFDLCTAGFGAPHIRQRLDFVWLADTRGAGPQGRQRESERRDQRAVGARSVVDGLEHPDLPGEHERPSCGEQPLRLLGDRGDEGLGLRDPGPVNGFWRDADWLLCRNPAGEPSWRSVEPGTFPLAHGVAARMGLLRGFGNAVVAPQTQGFIEAVTECMP